MLLLWCRILSNKTVLVQESGESIPSDGEPGRSGEPYNILLRHSRKHVLVRARRGAVLRGDGSVGNAEGSDGRDW